MIYLLHGNLQWMGVGLLRVTGSRGIAGGVEVVLCIHLFIFLKIYLPHDNLQGVGSYQLAFLACDGSLRWHCCHSVLCVHLFILKDLPALRQPALGNDALTRACLCQVACVCLLVLEALPWVEDAC